MWGPPGRSSMALITVLSPEEQSLVPGPGQGSHWVSICARDLHRPPCCRVGQGDTGQ